MNQSRAWRTVCDAALLDDAAASERLCEALAGVTSIDHSDFLVARALAAALAWLDPALAQAQLQALPQELISPRYELDLADMVGEFQAAQ